VEVKVVGAELIELVFLARRVVVAGMGEREGGEEGE
jgi:hypothetical protein